MTDRQLATIPATPLAVGTVRTYAIGLLVYGLAIVIQGPERWSGPFYRSATALAPSWVWGLTIITLGLITWIGSVHCRFLIRNVGLYGGALWFGLFGVTTLNVARQDPNTSASGSVVYMTLAVAMCWVARAREVPRHARRPKDL